MIKLSTEKLSELIAFYLVNKSLIKTAKEFNISRNTIHKILKENKIDTSKDFVKMRLNKIQYKIDDNYFNIISTVDKAYLLGLIFADGHIYSQKNIERKQLRLKINDWDLLEKVKEKLNYDKPLNKDITNPKIRNLIICNKIICEDLIKHGCFTNKTYNCKMPILDRNLFGDFIRGFFDGDGCICVSIDKRCNNIVAEVVLISTNEFILEVIELLKSYNIYSIYFRDKKHDERIGKLRIRRLESLKLFFNLIYSKIDENSIFLDRKYVKYKEFLENKKLI